MQNIKPDFNLYLNRISHREIWDETKWKLLKRFHLKWISLISTIGFPFPDQLRLPCGSAQTPRHQRVTSIQQNCCLTSPGRWWSNVKPIDQSFCTIVFIPIWVAIVDRCFDQVKFCYYRLTFEKNTNVSCIHGDILKIDVDVDLDFGKEITIAQFFFLNEHLNHKNVLFSHSNVYLWCWWSSHKNISVMQQEWSGKNYMQQ